MRWLDSITNQWTWVCTNSKDSGGQRTLGASVRGVTKSLTPLSAGTTVDEVDSGGTVACQAPPSMGLSRQEYWSGLLPFPSPCHPLGWLINMEGSQRTRQIEINRPRSGTGEQFVLMHCNWRVGEDWMKSRVRTGKAFPGSGNSTWHESGSLSLSLRGLGFHKSSWPCLFISKVGCFGF